MEKIEHYLTFWLKTSAFFLVEGSPSTDTLKLPIAKNHRNIQRSMPLHIAGPQADRLRTTLSTYSYCARMTRWLAHCDCLNPGE